jgi:hypothetical protein
LVAYDSIKIEETLEDLIFKIIGSYISFAEKRDFISNLYSIHQALALKYKDTIPLNIVDFLQTLQNQPLRTVFGTADRNNPIFNELFNFPLFNSDRLSEASYQFYIDNKQTKIDPLQRQQTHMKDFLLHCRSQVDEVRYQQIYTAVRVKLYNKGFFQAGIFSNDPQANLLTENELEKFLIEMNAFYQTSDRDEELIRGFYRKIHGPATFLICNHCHLPMLDENNCHNNQVCFHDKAKNRNQKRTIELKAGEVAYIPYEGIIFYNVIPGLEEYRIFTRLKKEFASHGASVTLFPNLERDGDIKLSFNHLDILIDVKDYRKPEELAKYVNGKIGAFFDLDYIYIPQYRKKYSDYMKVIRDQVNLDIIYKMSGKRLQILNEKQLIEGIAKRFNILQVQ